jgi:hypothetical protein
MRSSRSAAWRGVPIYPQSIELRPAAMEIGYATGVTALPRVRRQAEREQRTARSSWLRR